VQTDTPKSRVNSPAQARAVAAGAGRKKVPRGHIARASHTSVTGCINGRSQSKGGKQCTHDKTKSGKAMPVKYGTPMQPAGCSGAWKTTTLYTSCMTWLWQTVTIFATC